MKSEPDEFSIDDLAAAKNQTTPWFGVRNYQARNFMRDQMKVGDRAFFYHSSCPEPGIAGIVEVSAPAYPDATQFDRKSPYFDAEVHARRAALGQRRREVRREDAPRLARRTARASGARADARPAARQPAVDHAGRSGRVGVRVKLAKRKAAERAVDPALIVALRRRWARSSAFSPGSSASAAA